MRRLRAPLLCTQVIECELDIKLGHFNSKLEPVSGFPDKLQLAKTLNSSGDRDRVRVVNMTRRGQIIKFGQAVQVKNISPPSGTVLDERRT